MFCDLEKTVSEQIRSVLNICGVTTLKNFETVFEFTKH